MATFNTTDPKPGYVYEVATDTWFPIAGIAPGSSVDRWRKTAAGSETSVSGLDDLSVTLSYEVGTEQVYLNGVLLVRTSDYTATNGTSITGLSALAANDVVEVISFNPVNIEKTDAILSTAINAKGDLIAGSADNTPSILTVGTNGYVLAASSAAATGLLWTDSAASTQTLTNKTIVAANNTLTGVVNNTLTSTTGDIIYASAANTPARLGIGSTSQVLTVASGIPSWATPAGGSLTQLGSTATLSGASTTVSFTATGYQNLYVTINLVNPNGASKLDVQPNASATLVDVVSQRAISGTNLSESAFDSYIRLVRDQLYSADTVNSFSLLIYNVASTTEYKTFDAFGGYRDDSNRRSVETMGGIIKTTSALSSLKFQGSGSGYSGGTVRVYGVN